jgi:Uma2 family endonuclease
VIEISDASLGKDQGDKRINYGRAGVPVYWIVNLVERQIEVYSSPQPDGYAVRTVYRRGDYVAVVLDAAIVGQIAVAEILP